MTSAAPGKSLYAQLGVAADADQPALDAAYQQLQQFYQTLPDNPDTQRQQAALHHAYQLLSDPLRRKVYDASLLSGHASALEQQATSTNTSANISVQPALNEPQSRLRDHHWLRWVLLALLLALPGSCYYMVSSTQQKAQQLQLEVRQVQREEMLLGEYLYRAEDAELRELQQQLEQLQERESDLLQQARHSSGKLLQNQQQALALLREKRQLLARARQRLIILGAPLPPAAGPAS